MQQEPSTSGGQSNASSQPGLPRADRSWPQASTSSFCTSPFSPAGVGGRGELPAAKRSRTLMMNGGMMVLPLDRTPLTSPGMVR